MPNPFEDAPEEGTVGISTQCPFCGKNHTVVVPGVQAIAFASGVMAQEALPSLSPDQREMLITGICPTCWDPMPKDEEE